MTITYSDRTRELLAQRAGLTVTETAQVLNISRSSVYNRVADGTIPSRRIGGRVVIPAEAIRRLLQPGD